MQSSVPKIAGTSKALKSEKLSAIGNTAKLSAATAPATGPHSARPVKYSAGTVSALCSAAGKRQAQAWCPSTFMNNALTQNIPQG